VNVASYARFKRPNLKVHLSAPRWTSKAVCPADEARALMELKWNGYINCQVRTTPHKTEIPLFYGVVLSFCKFIPDSVKTPFLARARLNRTASVLFYPSWLALGHHL